LRRVTVAKKTPSKRRVRCAIGTVWLPDSTILSKGDEVELEDALATHLLKVGHVVEVGGATPEPVQEPRNETENEVKEE